MKASLKNHEAKGTLFKQEQLIKYCDKFHILWLSEEIKENNKTPCIHTGIIIVEESGHNPQVEEPEAAIDLKREFLSKD